MKLSLIVFVLAACLLTHGVVARASQPQLAGFSDFMTGHQWFGEDIIETIDDAVDEVEDKFDDAKDAVTGAINWSQQQFEEAQDWVQENSGKIDDLVDKGADVALKSLIAGATTYVKATAAATKQGFAATKLLSEGNWKEAGEMAIKAGVGFNDARTKAFKAAAMTGLKAVGLAKAAVLLNKIEKKMKAKKRIFLKNLGKKILKK